MLIKNNSRIITDDGLNTYKSFGFTVHLHNRFFSGSFIFMVKYGYKPLDRKIDLKLKHGVSFVKVRGLNTKFLEIRVINIPKGK